VVEAVGVEAAVEPDVLVAPLDEEPPEDDPHPAAASAAHATAATAAARIARVTGPLSTSAGEPTITRVG
jgi:hypothetical protein